MSASTRFLALALTGWIGLRAASLGLIPGGEAIAFDRKDSATTPLPAVATTEFAPLEPVQAPALSSAHGVPPFVGQALPAAYAIPVIMPGQSQAYVRPMRQVAVSAPAESWGPDDVQDFSLTPAARYADRPTPIDQWPVAAIARGGPQRGAQSVAVAAIRAIPGIDRLSMSAWAMMRRDPGAPSLATNGQLGGSQAGARFLWRFDRRAALSVRSSAPIGGVQRNAELAAGLRYQPFPSIPLALSVERRQSFGRDKGRSAFAMFVEGGVYDRPLLAGFDLDAYLQAGMVGIRDHAAFVDGSATLTRPIWKKFSAGVGVWGGAQPGLARLDAGPRASLRIGRSMRVHLDYRHRFVGKAAPGSGPVVTLAGDF